jgi:hypothetical protein
MALGVTVEAFADPPAPCIRTFAYWVTGAMGEVPDFLSQDSKVVIALPSARNDVGIGQTIRFVDGAVFQFHPAHHVQKKGGETAAGFLLWLDTPDCPQPPPPGAHTFTGPDGLILSQDVVRINKCSNGSCSNDTDLDGLYHIDEFGEAFVVVTALFSK